MRILWDFRLFSYGYAQRGVGTYTQNLASKILPKLQKHTVFIWGQKKSLPPWMQNLPVEWIHYKPSSWKKDLFLIPLLLLMYRIELIHYWIALGPIHSIGMGLFHHCTVVTTVYDLGVELWNGVPFAESKRKTWFWKTQKRLMRQSAISLCISESTKNDLSTVFTKSDWPKKVIYSPLISPHYSKLETRKPYFIMLGGSPHKNIGKVIQAFSLLVKQYPEFKLYILGEIQKKEELPIPIPEFLAMEGMGQYTHHRKHAAGLIFCSLYEGLGLPAIEAMQYNCPLLLSDIPSLREICDGAAVFVNPKNINDIARGIESVINNQQFWMEKSRQQKFIYWEKSRHGESTIAQLYWRLRKGKGI